MDCLALFMCPPPLSAEPPVTGGPFGRANKSYLETHELIVIHASSTNESGAPQIDCLALFAYPPFSTFIRSPMN